ncbi:hypothetical protein B566_EDAN013971, partial [Ephemera danica]
MAQSTLATHLTWQRNEKLARNTYCVDTMVADSACSATAYLCGVKANKATIGVTAAVILGGGRQNFRPFRMKDEEGFRGRRSDGVDLIAEWQGQKNALRARWAWAWNRATMEAINVTNTDFILGGRIDHAHHETRAQYALDETIQFDLAIRAALSMVDVNETLVVMTSDHSHTMSLNGYPFRGRDLL